MYGSNSNLQLVSECKKEETASLALSKGNKNHQSAR